MFALEIDFHDGISTPETVLVRRSNAIIGTSDQAHVVVEGAPSGTPEIRLVRGIGPEFRCELSRRSGQINRAFAVLEGSYRRTAELKVGDVTLRATSLDLDLCLLPDETPDKAAIRVLRNALSRPSPVFPAIAVLGPSPVFLSFPADNPLVIGRSRRCGLRLESVDVSAEHARVGVESGKIWVEDLGSTNGSFVNGEQISGRRYLERDDRITIGSSYTLAPVLKPDDVAQLNKPSAIPTPAVVSKTEGYPCLIAMLDTIRPSRFVFGESGSIRVGRDPTSEIWINSPHVSRQHIQLRWSSPLEIEVIDTSSNGTFLWSEKLPKGEPVPLPQEFSLLDFCSGVTLGLCFTLQEEADYISGKSSGRDNSKNSEATDRQAEERASGVKPTLAATDSESSSALTSEADYHRVQSAPNGQLSAQPPKWEDALDTLDRGTAKPASVFEQLVRRNLNQANISEEFASEIKDSFGDEAESDFSGSSKSTLGVGFSNQEVSGFTETSDSLRSEATSKNVVESLVARDEHASDEGGVLESEDSYEGSGPQTAGLRDSDPGSLTSPSLAGILDDSPATHETSDYVLSGSLTRGDGGGESLYGEESYEDLDFEGGGERRILRIVLGIAVVGLIGFSAVMLWGLFSDSNFY